MKFTIDSYKTLINTIKQEKYVLSNYREYTNYKKVVIIKHDVDMSLEKAAELAEFEQSMGVQTTYNILLCSDFYNPYSKKNMDCVNRIIRAGHDIGLHFDEVRYKNNIEENILREISILENFIGESVNSVSMHRPSKLMLESDMHIDNGRIVNTYSNEFFKNFKYVSDSRRNWKENPLDIVNSGEYDKIHILMHPIWYSEKEESMATTLKNFLNAAVSQRYETLNENIRDLEDALNCE